MDLTYFANLAEIIGTAAIVVSLIYVAVQIRQNNRHLAEEAQRARAQAVRESWAHLGSNAEAMAKELKGEKLTDVEALRMIGMWMGILFSYQTSFLQLPETEVAPMINLFRRNLETMESFHAAWEQNHDTFHPNFVQFMNENVFNR